MRWLWWQRERVKSSLVQVQKQMPVGTRSFLLLGSLSSFLEDHGHHHVIWSFPIYFVGLPEEEHCWVFQEEREGSNGQVHRSLLHDPVIELCYRSLLYRIKSNCESFVIYMHCIVRCRQMLAMRSTACFSPRTPSMAPWQVLQPFPSSLFRVSFLFVFLSLTLGTLAIKTFIINSSLYFLPRLYRLQRRAIE